MYNKTATLGDRPSRERKTKLIALRLPPRLWAFVQQLASEQNVTLSEALRSLVELRLRERQQDLREWRQFASRAFGERKR